VEDVLGRDAAKAFCYVYDVTDEGNFEGRNILNRPKTLAQCAALLGRDPLELDRTLAEGRRKLFEVRERRARPGRDDKVLTSWSALMIDSLARAGAVLGEPRYADAAARAAGLLLTDLRRDDGRLWHCWRQGRAAVDGLLEDYAALANALVTLYECQFDERWIDESVRLADIVLARFTDQQGGGFYTAPADHGSLIVRKKDMIDSSVPSGGGLAATGLLRLGKLCGGRDYLAATEAALRACIPGTEKMPLGFGQMLLTLDMHLGPMPEIVLVGSAEHAADREVLAALHRGFLPNKVLAFRARGSQDGHRSAALAGLFEGKVPQGRGPALYVCQDFACQAPVSGRDEVLAAIASLAGRGRMERE